MLKTVFFASIGFAMGLGFATPAQALDAKGVWLVESKKSHVEIYACNDKLCGKIVWLREPDDEDGKPKLDKKNKLESLRAKPLMGSVMISGMESDGKGKWDDGKIYNAEDGKTYSSEMEMPDNDTLEVSGCVLFFCKEQVWTRVK